MSRRRQAIKRSVIADAKYNSVLVGRLVNTVMFSGQKNVARRIVYGAIEALAEKTPGVDRRLWRCGLARGRRVECVESAAGADQFGATGA